MTDHNTAMVNPLWKLGRDPGQEFSSSDNQQLLSFLKISTQPLPAIPVVRIGERIIFNFLILEVVLILCHDSFPSSDE
jgi:hypothetical protein